MKPGATIRPVASIVSRASSSTSPTATMRPSLMPTSPLEAGRAAAVDDRAAGDLQIKHVASSSWVLDVRRRSKPAPTRDHRPIGRPYPARSFHYPIGAKS